MKTNSTQNTVATSYTVPMDVFPDVLKIFLHNNTDYNIEGINENENSLLIQVRTEKHNAVHKALRQNIASILAEYGYFLNGTPGELTESVEE